MIEIIKKEYPDHIKLGSYLQYTDLEHNEIFDNAHYYIIDLTSDEIKDVLSHVGGFCAEIMKRMIVNKNMQNVSKILFCSIPQKTNDYLMYIYYLNDKYENVTSEEKKLLSDNFYDYSYFKKRFSDFIIKEGFSYELKEIKPLSFLADQIEDSNTIYDFDKVTVPVNAKFTLDQEYFDKIFKENYRKELCHLDVTTIQCTITMNPLYGLCFQMYCFQKNGEILKNWQFDFDVKTKEEYIILKKEKNPEIEISIEDFERYADTEDYFLYLPLSTIKNVIKFMNIKDEKPNTEELELD